jgi:lysophospholipase L1-like esterase
MSLWDRNNKPKSILDPTEQSKTTLTSEGWVRTITYTDRHGNSRTKKEVLVTGFTSTNGFVRRTFPITGLLAEGDSLTFGLNATDPTTKSYPGRFATLTGIPIINQGNSGDPLSGIDTAYATNDAPSYNAATYNTMLLMAGTNDVGNSNATLAQLQASMLSIAAKARATGFRFAVGTLIACANDVTGYSTPAKQQIRADFNNWIRANWTTFADDLVDFGAVPALSDPTNSIYYNADLLHLNDAGYDVMGRVAARSLGFIAADTTAPTITSSATFSVAENLGLVQQLTANETVTWAKTGVGSDQSLFTLTKAGLLTMSARDFEAPIDSDTNNTYVVQVSATDAFGNATTQNITVTVTDVNESVSFATMDAAQTADMALSNGALTITSTTNFVNAHSLATKPLPDGLTYFEGHLITLPGDYGGIGFSGQNVAGGPGLEGTGKSQALYNNGGFYRNSGAQLTQWPFTLSAGSWVGILVNKVSSTDARIWVTIDGTNFYGASASTPVNAAGVATRTSGLDISATLVAASGALYPAVGTINRPGVVWDVNFGNAAWHFTPPSGYVGL